MILQQERLSALIKFTQQTLLINKKPLTHLSQHTDFVRTEEQLLHLPGVTFNQSMDTEEETWLRIERLHESHAPLPKNHLLRVWLSFTQVFSELPTLKTKILTSDLLNAGVTFPQTLSDTTDHFESTFVSADSDSIYCNLSTFFDKKNVEQALEDYIQNIWKPWLEQEKQIRKSIKLYGDLFLLSKDLQGNLADAKLELVWGVGVALWNRTDTNRIKYPLLTQVVEISLDKNTMALSIKPSMGSVKLETEAFSSSENPNLVTLIDTKKVFFNSDDITFNPFKTSTYSPILNTAASLLDPSGKYWPNQISDHDENNRKLPKATSHLVITDTWVLIARPRSDNFLLQDLEKFNEQLTSDSASTTIPNALAAILTEPDTENKVIALPHYRGISAVVGQSDDFGKPNDLYFPKAYNDEQVRIIQMLQAYDGVVVQGPPGTGKTHTIANVICHYLASGKRVLVTSMKEPALSVLKEKLPESIQPLAVSLLSSENESIKQFETAIRKISSEVSSIDRKQYQSSIDHLDDTIDVTHAQLSKTDTDIAYWGQVNLENVILDDEVITPLDAAKTVALQQEMISWFPDKLGIEDIFKPQFSNSDISGLREARLNIKDNLIYLHQHLPAFDDFPTATEVVTLHQNLIHIDELEQAENDGRLPRLVDNNPDTIKAVENLVLKTEQLKYQIQEISDANLTWASSLQKHLYADHKTELFGHFLTLKEEIKAQLTQRTIFITKPVTISDEFDNNPDLANAVKNLAEDKKPFGLAGLFGKAAEKKQLACVTVLGTNVTGTEDWQHVLALIEFRALAKSLMTRWNALAPELSLPTVTPSADSYKELSVIIQSIEAIHANYLLELDIQTTLQRLLPTWQASRQNNHTLLTLTPIIHTLKQLLTKHTLNTTDILKATLHEAVANSSGPIIDKIAAFVKDDLGNEGGANEDITAQWLSLMTELSHIHSLSDDFNQVHTVTEKIEQSGAVLWAKMLREQPVSDHQETLLPDNWREIWRLSRLVSFVEDIDARQELRGLNRKRRELEQHLSKLYQDVITQRTWLHLAENATPTVRAALEQYRAAIVRIGKGTGKRAPRYRREAQEASEQASAAIPCWIMPHYRISESLPASFGSFDLVIIDEASQSDLTALPALMRAKKVLVVGDDKQVSPDGIGLDEDKIKDLMGQHLANQVKLYQSQMSPERSIYDLFKVVFADSSVMLREHFRCAAPIIEFSKREFYDHELKPLRKSKPSERLDPPLVDIYVTDGFRNHRKTNPSEAQFILDEIKAIVEDADYKGRSIGVISLLGNEQARLIMEMLSRELGEKVITEFDIACGDARTFQGKEKDIIFLSLVVAPGDAHALTRTSFAQRINVAASRARDRMYLVRSINLDELSPADMYRAKLIQHFQQPFLQDNAQVEDLRSQCESAFETEVFDILVEHGYRVIPQVPVGQYRIDMVVEGENDNSLAIECDGDQYHGPDKWPSDMHRQRILERAGWTFWRCFASTFVLHKETVVTELLAELTRLHIHPIPHAHAPSRLYTETRQIQALAESVTDDEPMADANTTCLLS